MIIHKIDQGSPEWFELRAGRITGTRFKTLLMGKKTKGYQDLISELATEVITEGVADQEFGYTSPIMDRGKDLEPFARQEFTDVTGFLVEEYGFITPDENTEFADWIGVSPDGLFVTGLVSETDHGLEIKCPLAKTHLSYLEAGELPPEYVHQVQGSLFVSGLDSWYFMSYYPKMKPFITEVKPDQELHAVYEAELREIIHQVKMKVEKYQAYDYEKI